MQKDISTISGNAPDDLKTHLVTLFALFRRKGIGFANDVGEKVQITEVDVKEIGEKKKQQCTVTCEVRVEKDMTNFFQIIHGGCIGYLIDVCSSLPIAAINRDGGGYGTAGVSQSINIVFHSPAPLGTVLKIVSTTLAVGDRTMSSRCELWDKKRNRLVASGTHMKMHPSRTKL